MICICKKPPYGGFFRAHLRHPSAAGGDEGENATGPSCCGYRRGDSRIARMQKGRRCYGNPWGTALVAFPKGGRWRGTRRMRMPREEMRRGNNKIKSIFHHIKTPQPLRPPAEHPHPSCKQDTFSPLEKATVYGAVREQTVRLCHPYRGGRGDPSPTAKGHRHGIFVNLRGRGNPAPTPHWMGFPTNRRAGACSRRCNKFSLRSVYLRGNEYMRLPPGGGSAIGGGGACVCEIRNGDASSSSFLPRSPSVTLRAPPPSQREARTPQPLGNRRCIFVTHLRAIRESPLRSDRIKGTDGTSSSPNNGGR